MVNEKINVSNSERASDRRSQEIDYSPKVLTRMQAFVSGLKMVAAAVIVLGMLCLAEWYSR
jgi:hypothetical protein